MFMTRSEYDRGVNTFDPSGRLFQVEYAMGAIKLGSTAIAIQTSEGVVMAVEKRVESSLMKKESMKKQVKLDQHVGCAMSGLVADAGTLVERARVASQQHWFMYDEPIRVEAIVESVCDLALRFGEGGQARPFGVALLIAGVDETGPCLYHTDPSGTHTKYLAKAIGAGSESAQTLLQEQYNKSLTLVEAQKIALEALKQVMEDKISSDNIEMAIITVENPIFTLLEEAEIQTLLQTLSPDLI